MQQQIKSPWASTINWSAVLTIAIGWLSSPDFAAVIPPKFLPLILSAVGLFQLVRRNFFPNAPTTQIAADRVAAQATDADSK